VAEGFSRSTGLSVLLCLARRRATKPQSSLTDGERRQNVASAFTVRGAIPRRAILVDDIATSGATLETAAQALIANGCERVEAVVVATER
jgi:predicted amidophosphoribosyltransferase